MSEPLTLVIGTRRISSWSLRPWLVLRMAGAEFAEIEIALRQPDTKGRILEVSPSGKVPLLIHGNTKIWDSLAICEYAHELFPQAGLWPSDPMARAVARSVAAEMHSSFPHLRSVCSMDVCVHTPLGEIPAEVAAETKRIREVWAECRERFGKTAAGTDSGPFLFGRFTIADAMYAPVVTRFTTYDLPLDEASKAYCDAIWALPAMRDWRDRACS